MQLNNSYEDFNETTKTIALKIEKLLEGMPIGQISHLFSRINNKLLSEIKVPVKGD